MVGSDSHEVLEKVLPILKDMSTHVFPMGGLGTGHTMKTLNNYVSVGSIIALCDALVSTFIYKDTNRFFLLTSSPRSLARSSGLTHRP